MFRSITGSDVDLILSCTQNDPTGFINAERYRRELAQHQYRLEWTWIHQHADRLLARALWWGPADHDQPVSLDCLWVDPSVSQPEELAAALLVAGHAALRAAGLSRPPDYNLHVPITWRTDPAAVSAVAWRTRAAARAGLTEQIERLNLAWTAGTALPPRSTRLDFRPADDQAFLAAFGDVAQGSLDILTTRNLAAMGAEAQALDDLEFYLGLPGRRDWWRLAYAEDGALVGFIVPSRTAYDASVSYLGVLPDARGNRYVDDLLAEITHLHAAGAERITGTTDTSNHPMAGAFQRAGYQLTSIRVVLSAPPH